jgi:hypothetical protein
VARQREISVPPRTRIEPLTVSTMPLNAVLWIPRANVADPDLFLTPGSGIRDGKIRICEEHLRSFFYELTTVLG